MRALVYATRQEVGGLEGDLSGAGHVYDGEEWQKRTRRMRWMALKNQLGYQGMLVGEDVLAALRRTQCHVSPKECGGLPVKMPIQMLDLNVSLNLPFT